MKKEQIEKIVDSLYKATISKSLVWTLGNSVFNSDKSHKFSAKSLDGITKFSCTIKLDDNLKLETYSSLTISNPNIIGDTLHIYSNDYPIIGKINKYIYDEFVHDKVKVPNQDKVMDDILKGIDISEFRDNKIETILDNPTPDTTQSESVKKKSLFNKIFGK